MERLLRLASHALFRNRLHFNTTNSVPLYNDINTLMSEVNAHLSCDFGSYKRQKGVGNAIFK